MGSFKECKEERESLLKHGACLDCKESIDVRIVKGEGELEGLYGLEYKCIGTRWKACPRSYWGVHDGYVGIHMAYRLYIPPDPRRKEAQR